MSLPDVAARGTGKATPSRPGGAPPAQRLMLTQQDQKRQQSNHSTTHLGPPGPGAHLQSIACHPPHLPALGWTVTGPTPLPGNPRHPRPPQGEPKAGGAQAQTLS